MTAVSDVKPEILDISNEFDTDPRTYLNQNGERKEYESREEQRKSRLEIIQPLIEDLIAGDIELLDFRSIASEAQRYNYWGFGGVPLSTMSRPGQLRARLYRWVERQTDAIPSRSEPKDPDATIFISPIKRLSPKSNPA